VVDIVEEVVDIDVDIVEEVVDVGGVVFPDHVVDQEHHHFHKHYQKKWSLI